MVNATGIYERTTKNTVTHSVGWKILCEQEKTPFTVTSTPECPVMVFDGETPDWFGQFMADGGIGIVTDCHPDSLPFEVEYAGDASLENVDLTELGSTLARVQCLARLYRGTGYGKVKIHENRVSKGGIKQDEFPVFLFASYGQGGCFFTGLPIARLVTALGDSLRATYSFSHFSERIVSIDKHHLMKAMREILIMAFHRRELPYIHLDYFPDDYQSALAFRIDIDGIFGENLIRISKSAVDHGFSLTFFANKSLCKDGEEYIRRIDGSHEIGNHANIHNLYTDYDSNLKNIQECEAWLRELGIGDHKLFSAPRGMWNYSLHKALTDLGYLYTSDFGACIGGFPFFPYLGNKRSSTLQIPVNPFSVERAAIWRIEAERQEITEEYIAGCYIKIIEDNYKQGYPIILYSHPEKFGFMADYVFGEINKRIESMNLWKTTLTQFANWWIKRDNINYNVEYDPSSKRAYIKADIDASMRIKEIY